jgi:hypothetical protein
VWLNVPPAAMNPLASASLELEAFATVWSLVSPFFQVTVVPWLIVRSAGLNMKFIMQTCVDVGMQALPPIGV